MLIDAGHEIVFIRDKAQVFLFPGGPDILPVLYGEKPLKKSSYCLDRDLVEVALFRQIPRNMPKIGICRGAQLLNVMCGGSLYQHVNGHQAGNHGLWDARSKKVFEVTSTHHQMMIPPAHARILGWAAEATSKETEHSTTMTGADDVLAYDDPEVVWFKDEHCLCYQPHPEYGCKTDRDYFFDLLDSYIFNRVQGA
jgi:carbamoylphosphate synthase small subunit